MKANAAHALKRTSAVLACSLLCAFVLVTLSACGGGGGAKIALPSLGESTATGADFVQPAEVWVPPAEAWGIDTSGVYDGWVCASAESGSRMKFQVICGNATYNYDMSNTGKPSIFPLQSGDGQYKFRIMKNVQDKKYAEIHSVVCDVKLSDPFQPFLRPSDYANYSQNSRCVAKAAEITKGMTNDLAKIKAVYEYVCKTVKYDRQKAATVKSGYLPTPDETMATGKGICFDYASLAASMLRSQGIPTKVIFGYGSPDGLYHAWNMFYTKESGWVTVSYSINPSNWTRMDLTFSANGADGKFIGDGGNYKDVYMY